MKNVIGLVALSVVFSACGQHVTERNARGPQGVAGIQGPAGLPGQNGKDILVPGLNCAVYDLDGNTQTVPEAFANHQIEGTFVLPNLSVPDSQSSNGFPGMPSELQNKVGTTDYGLDCYGYLFVETSGTHILKLLSDDGSRLAINGNVLIDNNGLHSPTEKTVQVVLYRGYNHITVNYMQGPATQIALRLKMKTPNKAEQVVPASLFSHEEQ